MLILTEFVFRAHRPDQIDKIETYGLSNYLFLRRYSLQYLADIVEHVRQSRGGKDHIARARRD